MPYEPVQQLLELLMLHVEPLSSRPAGASANMLSLHDMLKKANVQKKSDVLRATDLLYECHVHMVRGVSDEQGSPP
jgi:hypothetical protein